MKRLLLLIILLSAISIFSQNGYTIIVDGKEVNVKDDGTAKAATPTIATPSVHSKSGVHIVKAGENLFSISRLYGVTVDELCNMNGINKNSPLSINQSLKIVEFSKNSSNFTSASLHIVKKGDTLYNISKRYGISVERLKELNNLTDNIISINQRLRVN
jgi:LysM repeat protein